MRRYLELGRNFQDQFCTLALVLAVGFRRLSEGESILWVSVSVDGTFGRFGSIMAKL